MQLLSPYYTSLLQVPDSNKIGLVYLLEDIPEKDVHPLLSSIFMEAAHEALDNMQEVNAFGTQLWLYVLVNTEWDTS